MADILYGGLVEEAGLTGRVHIEALLHVGCTAIAPHCGDFAPRRRYGGHDALPSGIITTACPYSVYMMVNQYTLDEKGSSIFLFLKSVAETQRFCII